MIEARQRQRWVGNLATTPDIGSGAPLGRVYSGRLNRSCECVQAPSWASWSDFEAYPAVCESPEACGQRLRCVRVDRRQAVINSARLVVHWMRLQLGAPPITR